MKKLCALLLALALAALAGCGAGGLYGRADAVVDENGVLTGLVLTDGLGNRHGVIVDGETEFHADAETLMTRDGFMSGGFEAVMVNVERAPWPQRLELPQGGSIAARRARSARGGLVRTRANSGSRFPSWRRGIGARVRTNRAASATGTGAERPRTGHRARKRRPGGRRQVLEAKPGFEPGVRALQARALPLGHFAV